MIITFITVTFITVNVNSQNLSKEYSLNNSVERINVYSFADSLKKKQVSKKSISAIFIGVGGGLALPTSNFKETANPTFGLLGRLEFSSTGIFPFVIGGEVNYYSFNSPDEFRTINLLNGYRTKILAIGLNIDYSLSKLFRSSFTMPFISVDVKSNNIKRDFDVNRSFDGLPVNESKISFGAGLGFTVFILDFSVKYNYMKDNSFIAVTTKTKFPIIRF